mmetsp:Transcript_140081/g.314581  ORF Transcript_140081/g.314581 Transcript_140081/m.314581 type:complete len:339 (+) Transcript_140081:35-1051(+)
MGANCCSGGARLECQFAPADPGQHAAPYDAEPAGNFAFVVPGDEELFVGGGALNGAVGQLLQLRANHPLAFEVDETGAVKKVKDHQGKMVPSFTKEKCPLSKLHHAVFAQAKKKTNVPAEATSLEIAESYQDCNVRDVVKSCTGLASFVGEKPFCAAFLSTFKPVYRPFNPQNLGLVYCVGPLGINQKADGEGEPDPERERFVYNDPQEFLARIFDVAANVMKCVEFHNKAAEPGDRVEVIRVPVVSGGTFMNPKVNQTQVALALLWGLESGNEGTRVELMPSDAMREAYTLYRQDVLPSTYQSDTKVEKPFERIVVSRDAWSWCCVGARSKPVKSVP